MTFVGPVTLWNSPLDHQLLKGSAFDLALPPLQAWPGAGSQQMLAGEGTDDKTVPQEHWHSNSVSDIQEEERLLLGVPPFPMLSREITLLSSLESFPGALPRDTARWRCSDCSSEFPKVLKVCSWS